MPELPDVEVLKRYVDATSLHKRVTDVTLREQLVEEGAPQTLRERLRGATLERARRHGKHLFIELSTGGWLHLHFGMTGTLESSSSPDSAEHAELRLDFADGSHLEYINERKFGAISLVGDTGEFVDTRELGPDPLEDDIDSATLREILGRRRGTLKGTLMTQEAIAGLGNVYVDEILFQAGIHPESATEALDEDDVEQLHDAMWHVLDEAIAHKASVDELPDDWLLPNREEAAECPRCDGRIEKSEVSGRATYTCDSHQELIAD